MRLCWLGETELRCNVLFIPLALFAWISGNIAAFLNCLAALTLHEAAHAVMSLLLGYKIESVSLQPYGCTAVIARLDSWFDELMIALAGPLCSALIYISCKAYNGNAAMLSEFAAANMYIAAVNMLPVFPLDGGRAASALLTIFNVKLPRRLKTAAAIIVACIVGALSYMAKNAALAIFAVFMISSIATRYSQRDSAVVAQLRRASAVASGRTVEVRHVAISNDARLSCALTCLSGGRHVIFCVMDAKMRTVAQLDGALVAELAARFGADKKIGEAIGSIDRLTQ